MDSRSWDGIVVRSSSGKLVAGSVGKVVAEAFSVVSGLAHQRKTGFCSSKNFKTLKQPQPMKVLSQNISAWSVLHFVKNNTCMNFLEHFCTKNNQLHELCKQLYNKCINMI